MAITINIGGTTIEYPSSSASPNWSQALIDFAQAVEGALEITVGPYDVSPQILIIDIYNPGTSVVLPSFAFPISEVRGVTATYAVFRETTLETVVEVGSLDAVYNANGPVGNKWSMSRERTGDAKISFYMTDTGQIEFSTTATLSGTGHTGRISYQARAILQDNS